VHKSIRFSPYFLLYGRDCATPLNLFPLPPFDPSQSTEEDYTVYAETLVESLMRAWSSAKENSRRMQLDNQGRFLKKRARMPRISVGEFVMLFHPSIAKNQGVPQRSGPYKVVELKTTGAIIVPQHNCINDYDDTVEDECVRCRERFLVSLHRLKLCKQPTRNLPLPDFQANQIAGEIDGKDFENLFSDNSHFTDL